MIRHYRARVVADLPQAEIIQMQEDIPGVWFDSYAQHVLVPYDAIRVAQKWLKARGRATTMKVTKNKWRHQTVPRKEWVIAPETMANLDPVWVARLQAKQREAVTFAQKRQGALIQIPTGRGKSLVGTVFLAGYLHTHQHRALVVAPLPEQWLGMIREYSGGKIRAAQVTGRVGFKAVYVRAKPNYAWEVRIERRAFAEALAAMTTRQRERTIRAIEKGLAAPGAKVPAYLTPFVQRTEHQSADYWSIRRKSDGTEVMTLDPDADLLLSPTFEAALDAEAAMLTKPGTVLAATATLRRAHGATWAEIASGLMLPADKCRKLVGARYAKDVCATRSASDLGLPPGTEVAVISWAVLADNVNAIKHWNPRTVILDESHEAKATRRTKTINAADGSRNRVPLYNQSWAAAELSDACERILLLTATPDPNTIKDLWAQYDLINPRGFGWFSKAGKRYFGGEPGAYGMVYTGATHTEELQSRSRVMHMVVQKHEMGDVSPMTRRLTMLGLDDLSAATATAAQWKRAAAQGASGTLELRLALAAESMHGYIVKRVRDLVANGKRVLISTIRREHVKRLVASLRKALGHTVPIYAATGDQSVAERLEIVAKFRVARPAVIVAVLDALSTGFNGLQRTHNVLAAGIPWTQGDVIQFEGRFERFDDERVTTDFEYLVPYGSVIEAIMDAVVVKIQDSIATIGADASKQVVETFGNEIPEEAKPAALQAFAARLLARADDCKARIAARHKADAGLVTTPDSETAHGLAEEPGAYMDPWRADGHTTGAE